MIRAAKKVARRYAQALLAVAREEGVVLELGEELIMLGEFLRRQKELNQFLMNPVFDGPSRAQVLAEVANRLSLSGMARNFMNLLLDKNRFGLLAEIIAAYQALADELEGRIRALVISARPLSGEVIERVVAKIEEISGKKVTAQVAQDPSLLGGLVVKIGSLVLDGSIRAQLAAIRESLEGGMA